MDWISVKDKLPAQAGKYLVVGDWMGIVEKGEFDGKNRWHTPFGNPTHWMSLPEPPKE